MAAMHKEFNEAWQLTNSVFVYVLYVYAYVCVFECEWAVMHENITTSLLKKMKIQKSRWFQRICSRNNEREEGGVGEG